MVDECTEFEGHEDDASFDVDREIAISVEMTPEMLERCKKEFIQKMKDEFLS